MDGEGWDDVYGGSGSGVGSHQSREMQLPLMPTCSSMQVYIF